MKKLALIAIVLLAGCFSSSTRPSYSDPKLAHLEEQRRALAESEQQCIDETQTRTRDQVASIVATPNASVESQTQKANVERDREISQCHARADEENAKIADQERKEYVLRAQQERDAASLRAILTTSQPQ